MCSARVCDLVPRCPVAPEPAPPPPPLPDVAALALTDPAATDWLALARHRNEVLRTRMQARYAATADPRQRSKLVSGLDGAGAVLFFPPQ